MTDARDDRKSSIQTAPWTAVGRSKNVVEEGRPFVVVPAFIERASTENCPDYLPLSSSWADDRQFAWKRFELNGTASSANPSNQSGVNEETAVVLSSPTTSDIEIRVSLELQLPRLIRGAEVERLPATQEHVSSTSSQWFDAAEAVEGLIDQHIDLVSGLFNKASSKDANWRCNVHGLGFRSCKELAREWYVVANSDQPRMALIVKLAQTLPDLLLRTCSHPRHTLRRERQLKPIGQIQEIDSSCLRWLARQPGGTVTEKAGVKQVAMAVVRVEDVDTPENRVVRELLVRAGYACDRYLREHGSSPDHPRVVQVNRFRHLLMNLLATTPICKAARLVGIPQPNYVLQRDPRYQVLWQAYIQLVRQQMLEDSIWRWRHRLYAEHATMCVIAALESVSDSRLAHGGDVLIQLEQFAGQFIDPRTNLGPWRLRGPTDVKVDLVLGHQLHKHPLITKQLASIGPDAVLVRRSPSKPAWLAAIWTVLDFDLVTDRLEERVLGLKKSIDGLGGHAPQRALLVQPGIGIEFRSAAACCDLENVRGIRVELPLQHHFADMVKHVKWTLELN